MKGEGVSVIAGSAIAVTGIAARQPRISPTGVTREMAMRVRSPPSRACRSISSASVSSVTALITSRPPGLSAARAAIDHAFARGAAAD